MCVCRAHEGEGGLSAGVILRTVCPPALWIAAGSEVASRQVGEEVCSPCQLKAVRGQGTQLEAQHTDQHNCLQSSSAQDVANSVGPAMRESNKRAPRDRSSTLVTLQPGTHSDQIVPAASPRLWLLHTAVSLTPPLHAGVYAEMESAQAAHGRLAVLAKQLQPVSAWIRGSPPFPFGSACAPLCLRAALLLGAAGSRGRGRALTHPSCLGTSPSCPRRRCRA